MAFRETLMFFQYNLFAFIWALILLGLSFAPGSDLPSVTFWDLLTFDKVAHIFFYTVLVFFLTQGFLKQHRFSRLRYYGALYAIIICIAYGGIIELFQGYIIPDRFADVMDFVANSIGCIFGSLLFQTVYYRSA